MDSCKPVVAYYLWLDQLRLLFETCQSLREKQSSMPHEWPKARSSLDRLLDPHNDVVTRVIQLFQKAPKYRVSHNAFVGQH